MPPRRSRRHSADSSEYIYAPSSSSEEDWGDDAWEVDGIIGEHIDTHGERRYKIAWSGWTRPDGTNWTWEREDGATMEDLSGSLKQWRKEKADVSRQCVNTALVPPFHPYVFPNEDLTNNDENLEPTSASSKKKEVSFMFAFTELTHQAHEMGVDLRDETEFPSSKSLPFALESLKALRAEREETLRVLDVSLQDAVSQGLYELGPAPQKEGRYRAQKNMSLWRRKNALQLSSPKRNVTHRMWEPSMPWEQEATSSRSMAIPTFNFRVDHSQPPGSGIQIEHRPFRPLPKGHPPTVKLSTVGGAQTTEATQLPISSWSRPSESAPLARMRDILQSQWSLLARAAGAASVTIVNEVNNEDIPLLDPRTFKYLESEYIYGPGVTRSAYEFMGSCECDDCTASLCSCQDDAEMDEDGTSKSFAYDANGSFTFSKTIMSYVIECNKNCRCDMHCRSRVAQRPRNFPIEIFRTKRCGWGARSTVALQRGNVLGVYTGELLLRGAAESFPIDRAGYLFDLDFMVSGSQNGHSVDAYHCGNWTRFVNHSCDPDCSLFSVIWDSVPAMHQPKIAFVVNKDIPARTELTIDYCPQARKGKQRERRKMPNTPDCMCGAKNCRGYIYLEN